jgi:hypothetical protein
MNDLKQSFHQYIELDDQINILESKLSELRKNRDTVEKNIVTIIEKNNLQKKDIKIGTSRFQYTTSEKKDGFTQHYVKKALYDYYGFFYDGKLPRDKCNEKADQVFQYLLANRTVKHKSGLKRVKDTPPVNPNSALNSSPNTRPIMTTMSNTMSSAKINTNEDTQSIRSIQAPIINNRPSRPTTPSIRHIAIGPPTSASTSTSNTSAPKPTTTIGSTNKSVRSIIIPQSSLQTPTPPMTNRLNRPTNMINHSQY